MREVVVNSTPLIVLCNVGKLDLLQGLYGEVSIPGAVFDEVTRKPDSACKVLLEEPPWIRVKEVALPSDARLLSARLHAGEVEVMALAREVGADLVIMDDHAAKKTAEYLGLTVTGTLGVLVKAKESGLVDSVSPVLERMKVQGFYLSADVESMVLRFAGEAF